MLRRHRNLPTFSEDIVRPEAALNKVLVTAVGIGVTAFSAKENHQAIVDFLSRDLPNSWHGWIEPSAYSILFFSDLGAGAELFGSFEDLFSRKPKPIIIATDEPFLPTEQLEFFFHIPECRKLVNIPFTPKIHLPPSQRLIVESRPTFEEIRQARFEDTVWRAARFNPVIRFSLV